MEETNFKELYDNIREAVYRKQWDYVRELYNKYKDSIPPLDTNIDWISKDTFEKLKQCKGLHIIIGTHCGTNKTKNSIALLFSNVYPYMMGWYD